MQGIKLLYYNLDGEQEELFFPSVSSCARYLHRSRTYIYIHAKNGSLADGFKIEFFEYQKDIPTDRKQPYNPINLLTR